MSLTRTLVAATVAASLALAPALAEARAGSKSSGGSRGSKTTTTAPQSSTTPAGPSNNLATTPSGNTSSTPVYPTPQKAPQSAVSGGQTLPPPASTTPNSSVNPQGAATAAPSAAAPAAGAGAAATAPGAMGAPRLNTPATPAAPAAQPSFMQRNPLLTGIAGGLLGATIANSLFGNSAQAAAPAEGSDTGSLIGTMLKWALILGAIALVVTMFRRLMRPSVAGPAEPSFRMGPPAANPGEPRIGLPQAAAAAAPTTDIAKRITGPDYDAFTRILTGLQGAWSAGDIGAMTRWATPEMQRFFAAELARNEARGFVNHIEDVELINGDVIEAWSEGNAEFCTARVTFSARDYDAAIGKQRGEPGWIVDGDPNHRVEATEIWTFARQPGTAWQLSAIEQTETV